MGKGRDKRKRRAKKDQQTPVVIRARSKPSINPPNPGEPISGEPDTPVPSPLKPRPHLRSGAIAIPEPEQEGELVVAATESRESRK